MRISTKIAQMELEVLRSRDSVYTKEDVLHALRELKLDAIESEMDGDNQEWEALRDCFDGETDADIALGWASKADESKCICNRKAFPADYIAETLEKWIRVYLREHIQIDTTSIELDIEDIGGGRSVVSVDSDTVCLLIAEGEIVDSFMDYMVDHVGK